MFESDSIQLGTCIKTHGVKGEICIAVQQQVNHTIKDLNTALLKIDGGLVPFIVLQVHGISGKGFIVKLKDVDKLEDAEDFIGCGFFILKDDIDVLDRESQEISQIIGYAVSDEEKGNIGVVADVFDNRTNPLLSVMFQGREILIPFIKDIVLEISHDNQVIRVKAPAGLIDMYLFDTSE